MAAIFQTTFSNAFSSVKMYEFRLRFHWGLFRMVQLTIFQHWFRKWLGTGQATSHYLNQWWLVCWRIYASLGLNELKQFVGKWLYVIICSCRLSLWQSWAVLLTAQDSQKDSPITVSPLIINLQVYTGVWIEAPVSHTNIGPMQPLPRHHQTFIARPTSQHLIRVNKPVSSQLYQNTVRFICGKTCVDVYDAFHVNGKIYSLVTC